VTRYLLARMSREEIFSTPPQLTPTLLVGSQLTQSQYGSKGPIQLLPRSQRRARSTMPFRTSRKNGMSRRRTALEPYPGGQTRRQTEEHGDLNVYNRMYQFYNYHADKDILIDEMCRGLILSLLRISGGTVQEYDDPLGWTAPYWQDHCSHHHAIVFHMKDQRRHSATFAETLSSFSGKSMGDAALLPEQYDADHKISSSTLSTWVELHHSDGIMKSMTECAADLAACIKTWIDTQTFGGADDSQQAVSGLDLVPSRLQLLKRSVVSGATAYEVVVDDREFEASKVDVAAYTTVTLQNVTPASGDPLMTGDPLTADTINHVPLKGKMYTFSGPVPKVWDRHRAELQHLFKPSFFEKGRYLLPNSKLHDETMDDFRTFPRGRHIWSNCVAEDRITFMPGSTQKLKLEYRMRTSVRDFFHKFRNDDISSSKLGRCVCLAVEPSIRRQHVGSPISAVLPKRLWRDGVVNTAVQYEPYAWTETLEIGPNGLSTGNTVVTKVVRQVFTLDTSVVPTENNTNPATAELWWVNNGVAQKTSGGVTTSPGSGWGPLKWDSITRDMLVQHPQLAHFVSKGDPIMFNVQINRLYTGSSLLKNHSRLGADKTGVKRKHEDKMYSNMGDLSFARAQQLGDVYKDHNLQSATGVGVAPLILEGDDKNTMVTVNVAAEEQAFENALQTLDQDGDASNGIQLDARNAALTALQGLIDTDGLKVHGSMSDSGLATAVGGLSTAITGIPGISSGIVGAMQANAAAIQAAGDTGAAAIQAAGDTGAAAIEAAGATGAAAITAAGATIATTLGPESVLVPGSVPFSMAAMAVEQAATTAAASTIASAVEVPFFGTPHMRIDTAAIAAAIAASELKVKTADGTSLVVDTGFTAQDIADKIAELELKVKTDPGSTLSVTMPDVPTAAEIAAAIRTDEDRFKGTIVGVESSPTSTGSRRLWVLCGDELIFANVYDPKTESWNFVEQHYPLTWNGMPVRRWSSWTNSYQEGNPNHWIVAWDHVNADIGQDANVGGLGTVIGGSFGGDDESVQVRMDTGQIITQAQSVPASMYATGTRVVRKQDGTFAVLA